MEESGKEKLYKVVFEEFSYNYRGVEVSKVIYLGSVFYVN